MEITRHACQHCRKSFTMKKNLLKHLRGYHNASTEAEILTVRRMNCPLEDCQYTCRRMEELRSHIESVHSIHLLVDSLAFTSETDFQKWKREEEVKSVASFVAIRRKSAQKNGETRQTLLCHRSGHYTPKGAGKYKLKALGSKKIGGVCPAIMIITYTPSGFLKVLYYKTHVGHTQDLKYVPLSNDEKKHISDALGKGFTIDSILEGIRESKHLSEKTDRLKRIHLLSRKDLHNIARTFSNDKTRRNTSNNSDTAEFMNGKTRIKGGTSAELPISQQTEVPSCANMQDALAAHQQQVVWAAPSLPEVVVIQQHGGNSLFQTEASIQPGCSLSQSILNRLENIRQLSYKADYMHPTQFALLSARLDSAMEMLGRVFITPTKSKRAKNSTLFDAQHCNHYNAS